MERESGAESGQHTLPCRGSDVCDSFDPDHPILCIVPLQTASFAARLISISSRVELFDYSPLFAVDFDIVNTDLRQAQHP